MTYKKSDRNQFEIVEYLRNRGASVQILSAVGKGCPDILVGWQRKNILMEIKVPKAKGQAAGKLTPDQIPWHASWRGTVHIVYTVYDVESILSAPQTLAMTDRIAKPQSALVKK